jgi:hypothetical protein
MRIVGMGVSMARRVDDARRCRKLDERDGTSARLSDRPGTRALEDDAVAKAVGRQGEAELDADPALEMAHHLGSR